MTEADLTDTSISLRDVQAVLLSMFSSDTILIGHSLESDLLALKVPACLVFGSLRVLRGWVGPSGARCPQPRAEAVGSGNRHSASPSPLCHPSPPVVPDRPPARPQVIHSTVVDTSVLFPHRLGLPYKRSLRNLMADYLRQIIQDNGECRAVGPWGLWAPCPDAFVCPAVDGHSSSEDASACMHLVIWKIREDAKTKR